eukprot:COSAG04_NODE_554_length_12674_cov_89.442068_2_plen_99_part_00
MALACVACVVTAFLSWLGMLCGVVKSIGSAISDGVVGLELRGAIARHAASGDESGERNESCGGATARRGSSLTARGGRVVAAHRFPFAGAMVLREGLF